MGEAALPYVLDGAVARLFPGAARSLACGPGRLGRGGVPETVLFDAGSGIGGADLFAVFWRDEASHMDWLTDFLCDPEMDHTLEVLAAPPVEDEEPAELYSRRDLTTLGSDVIDNY
jgi:hypothetical protein